ncbi:Transcription factor [Penicillium bovifimosum]|uniref:Transcription factor n=1 Tax=Penicillium bovifimosum TaxID=126998 RepID=A0A9W9GHK7_9EURO|nr:Transcription factor [Penicillium bovifimosum]KAJ5120553.1 Transcription factor [Penicillium bovifimosum]
MRSVSSPPDHSQRQDEEQTGVEIATKVLGKSNRVGQAPFYTGDSPGFGAVFDICSPSQQPLRRHILLASKTSVSLSPEDRQYLHYKGVFSMPKRETWDALLRAYFHHVHPIVPVIDATTLPYLHANEGSQQCNLLLLWSIFYVAANASSNGLLLAMRSFNLANNNIQHVSAEVWRTEGYTSRKEMRDSMYSRAKVCFSTFNLYLCQSQSNGPFQCLHHNGGERDQTVLLQSALLLGFYSSEAGTYTQPWLWLGVAISTSQSMGLHRCSAAVCATSPIPVQQQCLWRRLWWICFYRDRWLSLTMGRPLRINKNDCNTAMPSADDMLSEFSALPESISASYIPEDLSQLAEYWVTMVELTRLLGDTLTLSYQPFGPSSSFRQVEGLEKEIVRFRLPETKVVAHSPLATFYLYHLQLHYQAFLITFYRPFITKSPEGIPESYRSQWQAHVRNQIEMAALQTNAVLDILVRERLLGFSGPMTPPLLVPAMHVHLLNCKSTDPLSRHLGLIKLELCMIVLEQMQHTHPSSSVFRGIFLEAMRHIFPNYVAQSTIPGPAIQESSPPQDASADDSVAGITIGENAIDALMDEESESIFNFWESLFSTQT